MERPAAGLGGEVALLHAAPWAVSASPEPLPSLMASVQPNPHQSDQEMGISAVWRCFCSLKGKPSQQLAVQ